MSSTVSPDPQVQRILSLDGGPSAALTIRLFRTIEMRCPGFLASADVFAGTSDGSFMALYLASRLNDDTEHNLRVLDGAIQLSNDILRVLNIKLIGFLSGLLGAWAFQQSSGLEELLERTYGSMTLSDLDKKVVICSVITNGMRGVVFHNFDPRPTNRVSMVDAAMASSAFPMLMPRHKLNYGEYLDGAMAANNPTMAATIRVAQNMSGVIDNGDSVLARLPSLRVFSAGATDEGKECNNILGPVTNALFNTYQRIGASLVSCSLAPLTDPAETEENWGWIQWLITHPLLMVDVMLQAGVTEVSNQARAILGVRRYHRFAPRMAELGDVSRALFGDVDKVITSLDQAAEEASTGPAVIAALQWLEETGWRKTT